MTGYILKVNILPMKQRYAPLLPKRDSRVLQSVVVVVMVVLV